MSWARVDSRLATRAGLAIVIFLALSASDSSFASIGNVYTIFEGFAYIGMVALGLGIAMIAGEFDLSVGSMAAVSAIVAVGLASYGLLPSVLVAVAVAVAVGVLQGLAIGWLRINSLVFTVGTLIGLRGVAHLLSHEQTVVAADLSLSAAIQQQLLIFSPFSLFTLGLFVLAWVFLGFTRFGREIYAIGGGRNEALAAGVPLLRPVVLAFAISAGLAGLAGALVSLKSGSATPFGLDGLLLPAVTAALIGGTTLQGGTGSAFGIAVGVLTLRLITSELSLQGRPNYVESLATGVLLIVVLSIELLMETPQAQVRWTRWRNGLLGRTRPA